ncbi:MAG: TonB family protein [Terriglobia bacterium]
MAHRLLLNEVRPKYPPLAQINYIHGHVRLLVTVACDGRVKSIHVLRGHPFLALAALKAIRRWVYRPFMTRSGPAEFQTMVDVNFSLVSPNLENFPPQPDKFVARAVQPPRVRHKAARPAAAGAVARLRVLVDKKGHVVDSTLLSGTPAEFTAAKKVVARWNFQPARWGNLSVPWYADVNVPVQSSLRSRGPEQAVPWLR